MKLIAAALTLSSLLSDAVLARVREDDPASASALESAGNRALQGNNPFVEDNEPTISNGGNIDLIVILNDDDRRVRKLNQGMGPEIAAANKAKAAEVAQGLGVQPNFTYGAATYGFSVKGATQAQRAALEESDAVLYVEEDQVVRLSPIEMGGSDGGSRNLRRVNKGAERKRPDEKRRLQKGKNGGTGGDGGGDTGPAQTTPWGIARVGSVDCASGCGTAWIIDSGIDLDHPDLNVDTGRSESFLSARGKPTANDENGHGTHVAGTVAAVNNGIGVVGVAAGATVVSVRVLDRSGSGSYSGVIAGIDYVGANGAAGDVANMSLGGGYSKPVNDAVIKASERGVYFTLAAGNEGQDADNVSPASANGANIATISAFAQGDTWAGFSNFGNPPVDFGAPGVSVYSCWIGGGYRSISGTSMAAPHAAGVYLATRGVPTTAGTVIGDPDGNPDTIIHI